jgi:hypothetical protein
MNPQPIETAPKDGTVILTDAGFCLYDKDCYGVGKWFLCSQWGTIIDDTTWGPCQALPKLWTPVPDWIKNA